LENGGAFRYERRHCLFVIIGRTTTTHGNRFCIKTRQKIRVQRTIQVFFNVTLRN
jgi:hypothetical protein